MSAWESIIREMDELRKKDKRRMEYRKRMISVKRCSICGGKIVDGKCRGEYGIGCGLYFK